MNAIARGEAYYDRKCNVRVINQLRIALIFQHKKSEERRRIVNKKAQGYRHGKTFNKLDRLNTTGHDIGKAMMPKMQFTLDIHANNPSLIAFQEVNDRIIIKMCLQKHICSS